MIEVRIARPPRLRAALVALLVALLALTPWTPTQTQAQAPNGFQWELRADAIGGARPAVHAGIGLNVATDIYSRTGFTLAAGASRRDDESVPSARADLVTRFLLDPFAENRRGVYFGGGGSARWDEGIGWRGYLCVLAGIELTPRQGWRTSIEAGVGGGARLGIVIRRARRTGR